MKCKGFFLSQPLLPSHRLRYKGDSSGRIDRLGLAANECQARALELGTKECGTLPTIDEQVGWWTKQAAHDLEMARSNRENGFHDGCALMCQQAAEKYLKALYIKVHSATPPKTHQCDRLATLLGAPPGAADAARLLESGYMESRYPDAAQGVPFEQFDDSASAEQLQAAEEVQQWVLQQLGQQP